MHSLYNRNIPSLQEQIKDIIKQTNYIFTLNTKHHLFICMGLSSANPQIYI